MEGLLLVLLILFIALILFYTMRARENRIPTLRPIPAFDTMEESLARSIEAGRNLHLSLGIGGIATQASADTLAGLEILEHVAQQAAAAGKPPLVTLADPTTMLLAQNIVRKAHGADSQMARLAATQIRWISPEPAAYAAGVMSTLGVEAIEGNILVGRFGDEYLLIGEATHHQNQPMTTVAGSSNPEVLPFILATSPKGLWGEEIFAAGAYLAKKPAHLGSLLAQDAVRWILGLIIIIAVLLRAVGLIG